MLRRLFERIDRLFMVKRFGVEREGKISIKVRNLGPLTKARGFKWLISLIPNDLFC